MRATAVHSGEPDLSRDYPPPRLVAPVFPIARAPAFSTERVPAPVEPHGHHDRSETRGPHAVAVAGTELRPWHRIAERVAGSRITVLVTGETGSGKEVMARRIHERSARARGPFVCVNCAAICDTLIEGQLFGHERGAFTGAAQSRAGLIESADGGTLFLDEVGELSLTAQAKLLRVLETKSVMRVGATSERAVDVRIVAATNRDLTVAVAQGQFRADLLFRLDAIRISLPPLRDRADEIVPAAREFLAAHARRERVATPALTEDAEQALRSHPWPGNFRELRNVIERAALLCEGGVIEAGDLLLDGGAYALANLLDATPGAVRAEVRTSSPLATEPVIAPGLPPEAPLATPVSAPAADPLAGTERDRIISALASCAGNQTRAARVLGISRRTLVSRLSAYAIPRPRAQTEEHAV